MFKTAITTALALSASLAAAGCGGSEATNSSESTPITVAAAPVADYAPVFLGVEKGFFEEEGLEVEFASGRVGTETITSVLSGTHQFAGVALPPLLVAQSQNLPVSVVTPSSVRPSSEDKSAVQLLTTPQSGIKSVEDLKGATIAVNALKAQLELMVTAAVEQGGGDPGALQFVEVPFPEMPAALKRGDVDAIAAVEPFLNAATADGAVSVAEIDRALPDGAPITTFFTSAQLAESDPELVQRFQSAMTQSLDYAAEHPEEVRAIIPEYSEVPNNVAQAMTLPTYSSSVDREGVEGTVATMEKFGFINARPDVGAMLEDAS